MGSRRPVRRGQRSCAGARRRRGAGGGAALPRAVRTSGGEARSGRVARSDGGIRADQGADLPRLAVREAVDGHRHVGCGSRAGVPAGGRATDGDGDGASLLPPRVGGRRRGSRGRARAGAAAGALLVLPSRAAQIPPPRPLRGRRAGGGGEVAGRCQGVGAPEHEPARADSHPRRQRGAHAVRGRPAPASHVGPRDPTPCRRGAERRSRVGPRHARRGSERRGNGSRRRGPPARIPDLDLASEPRERHPRRRRRRADRRRDLTLRDPAPTLPPARAIARPAAPRGIRPHCFGRGRPGATAVERDARASGLELQRLLADRGRDRPPNVRLQSHRRRSPSRQGGWPLLLVPAARDGSVHLRHLHRKPAQRPSSSHTSSATRSTASSPSSVATSARACL